MKKLKIKSIKQCENKQVYDLSVNDNHNFFITDAEILTHNCDYLSLNSQALLRGVMENNPIARFILTCNYPNRVIPAIHSRCQGFHIEKVDQNEFTARAATILISENVKFDLDVLDTVVKATYPDLRKCINLLEMNTLSGELYNLHNGDTNIPDYKLEMVKLFKERKISEARKLICSQARPDEMEEIYRWLYDNVELFGNETQQDDAILVIKQGLVDHTICADSEINLSAVLVKLSRL